MTRIQSLIKMLQDPFLNYKRNLLKKEKESFNKIIYEKLEKLFNILSIVTQLQIYL